MKAKARKFRGYSPERKVAGEGALWKKVGVEKGFGPGHMENSLEGDVVDPAMPKKLKFQGGAEAVPSELPSPPYEGEGIQGKALRALFNEVRQGVLPDEAIEEIKRNPASLGSLGAYLGAAMALSGGKGGKGERLALPPGESPKPSGASYGNVPDTLMGYPKAGREAFSEKGYADERYKYTQPVKVIQPNGDFHYDEIKGLNKAHALERARRNWDGATIEAIGEGKKLKPGDEGYQFKVGTGKVGVARGFGPRHSENAKEGDLTQVNTDTVPAMLTPREAVLNRNAAELAGRGEIEALNAKGNALAKRGVDLAQGGEKDVRHYISGSQEVPPFEDPGPLPSPPPQHSIDTNPSGNTYYDWLQSIGATPWQGPSSSPIQENPFFASQHQNPYAGQSIESMNYLGFDPSKPTYGFGSGEPSRRGIDQGLNVLGNATGIPGVGFLAGKLGRGLWHLFQNWQMQHPSGGGSGDGGSGAPQYSTSDGGGGGRGDKWHDIFGVRSSASGTPGVGVGISPTGQPAVGREWWSPDFGRWGAGAEGFGPGGPNTAGGPGLGIGTFGTGFGSGTVGNWSTAIGFDRLGAGSGPSNLNFTGGSWGDDARAHNNPFFGGYSQSGLTSGVGVRSRAKGDADVSGGKTMKSKPKQNKPKSGSPYVQGFEKLIPKGYAGGGYVNPVGKVPSTLDKDPYGGYTPGAPAGNPFGKPVGGGMPPPVSGTKPNPVGGDFEPVNKYQPYPLPDKPPGGYAPPPAPSPPASMSGGAPEWSGGTPLAGQGPTWSGGTPLAGAGPSLQSPAGPLPSIKPMQSIDPWGGRMPHARGRYAAHRGFFPPGMGFASGSGDVGIGDPDPQSIGSNFGAMPQLSAPDLGPLVAALKKEAQKQGLSASQIQGILGAFQGVGGGGDAVGYGGGTSPLEASGGFQGGISDIGYPPFAAPSAEYHGDKGSTWIGQYDPNIMIPRY